jgi:hypothetical protein
MPLGSDDSEDDEGWRPVDINVRQIIEDFLEGYSADPEEVMVVESIANSLDAQARNIRISLWRTEKGDFYSLADDGAGMSQKDFEHSYHALAFSTKEKGGTIGFAGVGGKLYLAMLEAGNSIYTETRSNTFYGASELTMKGDNAKWKRVPPRGKIKAGTGTYVELILRPGHSLDQPTVERVVQENYNAVLLGLYGKKSIYLSWKAASPLAAWEPSLEDESESTFNVEGSKCTAYFWLAKDEFEEPRGFDIVILGKRIKSDQWFDTGFEVKPDFSRRVCGLVTADVLAKLLTTNKQDLKVGNERTWLAFKKQVNTALIGWLASVGAVKETPKPRSEDLAAANEVSEMINRMLKLPEFSIYNPFLRRTTTSTAIPSDTPDSFVKPVDGGQNVPGTGKGGNAGTGVPTQGGDSSKGFVSSDDGTDLGERVRRRLRSGINVNIDDQPKNLEEGWVTPEAVVVNKGHPVYKKFQTQGYSHEINNVFRCAVTALIENADPSKKAVFDELRRFYKSWATLT